LLTVTTPEQVFGPLSPVEALTAIAAIQKCLIDYCHGIDRCDADLVASVYHPDATDDHGSFVGLGTEFAFHATKKLREYAIATTHFCGLPSITFETPTIAHVETQVLAWHRVKESVGPREFLEQFCGRYFDRFECRDGDWRIAHRALTHDWDHKEFIDPAFASGKFTPSPRSKSTTI
jgi:hypothetical protein